jgi:hypothetical protein
VSNSAVQPGSSAQSPRGDGRSFTPAILGAAWLAALAGVAIGGYLAPGALALLLAGVGLGLPLIWASCKHPQLAILALVFFTNNFVPPDLIDVRVLGGGLDVRDMLLLTMLGVWLLAGLRQRRLAIPWRPVSLPLLVFLWAAIFSTLYALLYHHVELNWAFSEFRPIMYYTIFLAVAAFITSARQLSWLLVGLFALADLTSTLVLMQQFLGRQNVLLAVMNSSAWYVREAGPSGSFGTVRIVPPGHVLCFIMSIMAFCLMLYGGLPRRARLIMAAQFVYLNVGLLFTYTRAQWLASALAVTIAAALLPKPDKRQLRRASALTLLLAVVGYGLFGATLRAALADAPVITALTERALSLFTPDQTLETNSLEWRVLETKEAYRSALAHPLIGVGLGNVYREPFLLQGEASGGYYRRIRFVHNSYLYLMVKMGVTGLGPFVWFAAAYLWNGWRAQRAMHNGRFKRYTLALLAGFAGFLPWAGSQSHLLQVESTVIIGVMVGMIVVMQRIEGEREGLGTRG